MNSLEGFSGVFWKNHFVSSRTVLGLMELALVASCNILPDVLLHVVPSELLYQFVVSAPKTTMYACISSILIQLQHFMDECARNGVFGVFELEIFCSFRYLLKISLLEWEVYSQPGQCICVSQNASRTMVYVKLKLSQFVYPSRQLHFCFHQTKKVGQHLMVRVNIEILFIEVSMKILNRHQQSQCFFLSGCVVDLCFREGERVVSDNLDLLIQG